MTRRLFTSESVTEGHPDKIADQISDSILDALLAQDPSSRVAVETLITTGQVHVAGEVTTDAYADIPTIVRETILEIGYDSSRKGFDGASCGVSVSIGSQSPELAEELALTTAELSYLPERRQAFDNLGRRCGHPGVRAVATALNQAEKYGTPLGQALRVTATENREMRMQEAERKAAALPAKLTVPMIIFFLPCLFIAIMGPAIIQIRHTL